MSDLMKVSSNPHIRSKASTSSIMLAVLLLMQLYLLTMVLLRAFWKYWSRMAMQVIL